MPQPLSERGIYQLILPYGQSYWEWNSVPKVQLSSRGDSGLPPGQGYRSAPEVERSASVALIGIVIVDLLLIVLF